jgi:Flp pilus assembly protein CpaB
VARPIETVAAGSNRNRAVLMLAVVFGLFSAMLVFAFLNSRDSGNSALEQVVNGGAGAESVVVAAQDIKAGDSITAAMLKVETIPVTALLPGRLTNTSDAVDKIAVTPIYTGEQIVTPKISTLEGQRTLAFKIPKDPNMRALTLSVPGEAWINAGLPQPGDRVDILGITTLTRTDALTGQERPDVVAGIIAQDVEILAVAQTLVPSVAKVDPKLSAAPVGTATPVATATSASGTAVANTDTANESRALDTGQTFEKAISITLALPVDLAAKLALLDAMDDALGQYRIISRRQGNDELLSGNQMWTYDDIFPKAK